MTEVPASIELQARALEAMAAHLRAEACGEPHVNDGACPICHAHMRAGVFLRAESKMSYGGSEMMQAGAGVPMLGVGVPFAAPPVVEERLSALARGFAWGWWSMVVGALGMVAYWFIKNG